MKPIISSKTFDDFFALLKERGGLNEEEYNLLTASCKPHHHLSSVALAMEQILNEPKKSVASEKRKLTKDDIIHFCSMHEQIISKAEEYALLENRLGTRTFKANKVDHIFDITDNAIEFFGETHEGFGAYIFYSFDDLVDETFEEKVRDRAIKIKAEREAAKAKEKEEEKERIRNNELRLLKILKEKYKDHPDA